MTDYHFGPLFRFVPDAVVNAMTRIVSASNRIFARHTPVEFIPDDPSNRAGYNRYWYIGRNEIIHNSQFEKRLTVRGFTFLLTEGSVLVAHIVSDLVYFCTQGVNNQVNIWALDMSLATNPAGLQGASDKIIKLATLNPSSNLVTSYHYDQVTGDLVTTEHPTTFFPFDRVLTPAFSVDGTLLKCGYGNSNNWMADVVELSLAADPIAQETLDNLRDNPVYPDNLTYYVRVVAVVKTRFDGERTEYGATATWLNETNSPGNLGISPTTQSYINRSNSTNYIAGQKIHIDDDSCYWTAANSGQTAASEPDFFEAEDEQRPGVPIPKSTVSDGTITWNLGGRIDGTPVGAFTYAYPMSQEGCLYKADETDPTPTGMFHYPATLEDALASWHYSTKTYPDFPQDESFELVSGPSAFSPTSHTSLPVGWGTTPLGSNDVIVNPFTTRVAKVKKTTTTYGPGGIPDDPVETWEYVYSYRSVFLYRYTVDGFNVFAQDGGWGETGIDLLGWALNPDTQLLEDIYYQEVRGTVESASKTGLRPVEAFYTGWPGGTGPGSAGVDAYYADMLAAAPGELTGGDYSYTHSGDDRIIRGLYIGGALQYDFYDGNQSFSKNFNSSGGNYEEFFNDTQHPVSYNKHFSGATITHTETYSQKKQQLISPCYNYQARVFATMAWSDSTWYGVGGSSNRSITQSINCYADGVDNLIESEIIVNSTTADFHGYNGNLIEPYIGPLNILGACLMSLYWQYRDTWPGGTANPYVNQKLFTSAGQSLTEVDFNGTVVVLADLNTAYPGDSAEPMYLEIVSE